MKPSQELAEALAKLQSDHRFEVLLDWLAQRLDRQRKENDSLYDYQLGWGQGRAQELNDLLSVVARSPDYVARFARNEQTDHADGERSET